MTSPLATWVHNTVDIPEGGLARQRAATEAERAALALALKIPSVDRLETAYRITALPGGGFRLAGDLAGAVVQACVITLEPIPLEVNDSFTAEYWPDTARQETSGELGILDETDIERLDHGQIDAGRIVFETLSSALDPYPRKQDAQFDWEDRSETGPEKSGPFAVLAKLRSEK